MTFSVNFSRIIFKCNLNVDPLKGYQLLVRFHLKHLCESLMNVVKQIFVKRPGTKLSNLLKLFLGALY